MFDLGLDSKLRACDLVKIRVRDICHGEIKRLKSKPECIDKGAPLI
jgi:hypothetical protein